MYACDGEDRKNNWKHWLETMSCYSDYGGNMDRENLHLRKLALCNKWSSSSNMMATMYVLLSLVHDVLWKSEYEYLDISVE